MRRERKRLLEEGIERPVVADCRPGVVEEAAAGGGVQHQPVQGDLLDHLGVQPIDGRSRRRQIGRNARRGCRIELPLREPAVLDALGRVDLIGEDLPDKARVNTLAGCIGTDSRQHLLNTWGILDGTRVDPLGRRNRL